MEKFRDIRVKYNHPAIPPIGIKLNYVYTVGYLIDNYSLSDLSIKTMFIPVGCKWKDLEEKASKRSKREVKIEEISDEVEV